MLIPRDVGSNIEPIHVWQAAAAPLPEHVPLPRLRSNCQCQHLGTVSFLVSITHSMLFFSCKLNDKETFSVHMWLLAEIANWQLLHALQQLL